MPLTDNAPPPDDENPKGSNEPLVGDDEAKQERLQRLEGMLPWGFESKLAACLGVVKVPLVLFVAFIAVKAENHLKWTVEETWYRYGESDGIRHIFTEKKTGCYVHKLKEHVPHFGPFNYVIGSGEVVKTNITLDPFKLGRPDSCEVDRMACATKDLAHPGYWTGGINHIVSFGIIWLIYKLVFIGIHPIDRLALLIKGSPPVGPDYPEPLMKLMTEPYFQKCTTPMMALVKVLFYFRYKMMPNTLLGALVTMHDMKPECPRLLYYKMSPAYGNACYFLCLVDLVSMVGAYVYIKMAMGGQLIGRWRYRAWKTVWLISAAAYTFVAIWATFRTFGGIPSIFRAILGALFVITLNFRLAFTMGLDTLKVMAFVIFTFEFIELSFLLVVIVGPKVAPHFFEKFKFLRHDLKQSKVDEAAQE